VGRSGCYSDKLQRHNTPCGDWLDMEDRTKRGSKGSIQFMESEDDDIIPSVRKRSGPRRKMLGSLLNMLTLRFP
jgi:hypothetical protein